MIQWEVNKHRDLGYGLRVPVHSECESDPSKQKLLMAYPEWPRARHIFSNIFGRLPAEVHREIKQNTPNTAILKDAKLKSNKQIKRIITGAYQSRGKECDESHCIIHGKGCSINPLAPPGLKQHRVRIAAGGVPCIDHSAHGNQEGDAGKAAGAHRAFFQDTKHRKYSVVFTGCTHLWDAEPSAQEVKYIYLGCECVLCPRMVGDAYSRKRRLTTLFNKEEARLAEPLEDFAYVFGGEATFTFHELFNTTHLEHNLEQERTLATRLAPVDSTCWLHTLLPFDRE